MNSKTNQLANKYIKDGNLAKSETAPLNKHVKTLQK